MSRIAKIDNFVQSCVYYVEYESDETKKDESFYYALVENNGNVRLYDDGIEVVEGLKNVLDKRRSFWQRLNEFTLIELIGAMIALFITLAFVYMILAGKDLNKEFTGMFGIIAGYYFGKNVSGKE